MEHIVGIYTQLLKQLGISPCNRQVDLLWLLFWTIAAIFLYTWQLGNLPLRDWDEGIVAIVAREMSRSPFQNLTWLFPTMHHAPYWNKPPLVHWLIALLYKAVGVNEWTTRLPGAGLAALSVPLLYGLTRELLYQRLPAIFAAGVYLTYLPMLRQGRLAMLDGAIVCFLLLNLNCVVRSRRDLRWSLGIGIGIGLMCLTKGLLGLVLGAIGLLFLGWNTRRVLQSSYFWLGLFLGMIPVLGWYGAQCWHYGAGYLQAHFLDQALDRVSQSVEKNGQPVWFYLWEILKYGAVWLVFLPLGLQLLRDDLNLPWARLLLIWLGGYFSIISFMQTKLPWYAMPLYPAMAIVIGNALSYLWQSSPQSLQKGMRIPYERAWGRIFSGLFPLVLGGLIYYGGFILSWNLALVFLALALTLFISIFLLSQHDRQFVLILIWGTYVTLFALVNSPHWIWELAEQYPVKPIAALVQSYSQPQQPIYTTFPAFRPSLDFYSDRQVIPTTIEVLAQQPQPWTALLLEESLPQFQSKQFKGIQIVARAPGWAIVQKKRLKS